MTRLSAAVLAYLACAASAAVLSPPDLPSSPFYADQLSNLAIFVGKSSSAVSTSYVLQNSRIVINKHLGGGSSALRKPRIVVTDAAAKGLVCVPRGSVRGTGGAGAVVGGAVGGGAAAGGGIGGGAVAGGEIGGGAAAGGGIGGGAAAGGGIGDGAAVGGGIGDGAATGDGIGGGAAVGGAIREGAGGEILVGGEYGGEAGVGVGGGIAGAVGVESAESDRLTAGGEEEKSDVAHATIGQGKGIVVTVDTGRTVSASAGHGVSAIAGHGASATAGHGVSAIAGHGASATAGHGVSAIAGHGASATAGHGVSATAGQGASVSAGDGSSVTTGHHVTVSGEHDASSAIAHDISIGETIHLTEGGAAGYGVGGSAADGSAPLVHGAGELGGEHGASAAGGDGHVLVGSDGHVVVSEGHGIVVSEGHEGAITDEHGVAVSTDGGVVHVHEAGPGVSAVAGEGHVHTTTDHDVSAVAGEGHVHTTAGHGVSAVAGEGHVHTSAGHGVSAVAGEGHVHTTAGHGAAAAAGGGVTHTSSSGSGSSAASSVGAGGEISVDVSGHGAQAAALGAGGLAITLGPDGSYKVVDESLCECVPAYLCDEEGYINTFGSGLIDIRTFAFTPVRARASKCKADEACCRHRGGPDKAAIGWLPSRCGTRAPVRLDERIVGGEASRIGQYPWMVALLKVVPATEYAQEKLEYLCGGSLIADDVVLTGAHCVKAHKNDKLIARVGEWDTSSDDPVYPHQDLTVTRIVYHDDFNDKTLFNDVALLKLEEPVQIAPHVNVLCLPTADDYHIDYSDCVATGWGQESFENAVYSSILKEVPLSKVDQGQCQDRLRQTRLGRWFQLHDSFLCAGGHPGVDTCKGDGGSPLACRDHSRPDEEVYVQTGIVAWGINCGRGGFPGVYVDVIKMLPWIHEHLPQISEEFTGGY